MSNEPLTATEQAMIDDAWETHKAALPVARVINDNQPGNTAVIEILTSPPTLGVGTELFVKPQSAARNLYTDFAAPAKPEGAVNAELLAARERLSKFADQAASGIDVLGEVLAVWIYPEGHPQWERLVVRQMAADIRAALSAAPSPQGREGQSRREKPKKDIDHASTSPGPVNCNVRAWFQATAGDPIPKSCNRCGLGPCPFFNEKTGAALAAPHGTEEGR